MRDFLRSGIPWPWARDRQADGYPTVPSWPVRHPITSALISVAAIVAVAVPVYKSVTSSPCGLGLTAVGSPDVCVGLDLRSTPMLPHDPLSGLEAKIAAMNSRVTGPFATIVLLEDLTPDPHFDTRLLPAARHSIEGAITAVRRADGTEVAGSATPRIKLLLANFGSGARWWEQAVAAIEGAQRSQHIVAVTGIGQSLDNTRAAVAALSRDQITTIGSDVTADNMNKDLAGQLIPDFFRVAPDNTDEANVAVRYINEHLHPRRIMLVYDQNPMDSYAQTLTTAFRTRLRNRVSFTEPYTSPMKRLIGATRNRFMISMFGPVHRDICSEKPDFIYFAGRGNDLASFLRAMASSGFCLLPTITLMTGDSASNIIGGRLPSGFPVRLLFTALATRDEWPSPANAGKSSLLIEATNYSEFAAAFAQDGFVFRDLLDGQAMMEHDAVLIAAIAMRNNPATITDPEGVTGEVRQIRCRNTFSVGASGFIAFGKDGNPVDKVMPVLQINPDGKTTPLGLPQGPSGPLDYYRRTC
jgi:ABC-type branched-subunit amino acid transport system substrate-binding protein